MRPIEWLPSRSPSPALCATALVPYTPACIPLPTVCTPTPHPTPHTWREQVDRDAAKVTRVAPLPHMFVVKDLVVDMANFYAQYKYIQPYLQSSKPKP